MDFSDFRPDKLFQVFQAGFRRPAGSQPPFSDGLERLWIRCGICDPKWLIGLRYF
jgi:hypothetical protein